VSWADVSAHQPRNWFLCTVTSKNLIILIFAAERDSRSACKNENRRGHINKRQRGKPVTWSGEIQSWPSAVVEGDVGSGSGFPSSPVSSVSLLSPLLCFSVIFSSSPLSLRGCQRRLEMAVSAAIRWCAVAVERKHGGSCGCSSGIYFFSSVTPLSLLCFCFSLFFLFLFLCIFFSF